MYSLIISFKRCVYCIAIALLVSAIAAAAPPLTVVQDILFNADGTRFNGIATISWQSFEASDMTAISAHTITTQIVNGLLRVQLVPTTNALSPASYTVVYNSNGSTQFTENWAVPPSNVPLRVRDLRVGGPGSTVGGNVPNGSPSSLVTGVSISDVVGLSNALNLRPTTGTGYVPSRVAVIDATGALNGATGNPGDCLHVDGSSGTCGTATVTQTASPTFVDGEIPAGNVDGLNASFALGNIPSPVASLMLFRNGMLMRANADYTLSGNRVTFLAGAVPQANDLLLSSYRIGPNTSGISFVDSESPAGAVDGSNTVFTLAQTPNPIASLAVYRNGLRLRVNLDYTLNGNSVLFQTGLAPQQGDVLLCSYRTGGH